MRFGLGGVSCVAPCGSLIYPVDLGTSCVEPVVSVGLCVALERCSLASCVSSSGCTLVPWLLLAPVGAVTPGWLFGFSKAGYPV